MRIQKLQFSNVEKWIKRNKQDKQLQFDGTTPTKSVRCLLDSWIDNGDSGGALSRPITTSDKQQCVLCKISLSLLLLSTAFVIILNIG
ncbi:hypothetical protein T4D_13423 [Trichinella pseudospiralis]|uniref:Uncharacterized protein n=1 Tax=Trichinella pseudospiralis TaxID=6337 RepID=A0A0V1FCU3_TRIPS|nr:hypothetical protein T4D_13423 [Trichinella pseudospiralis]